MKFYPWQREILFDLTKGVDLLRQDVLLMRYGGPRGLDALDKLLAEVEVTETQNEALLCILVSTSAVANQLRNREDFYKRVAEKMGGDKRLIGLACEESWA